MSVLVKGKRPENPGNYESTGGGARRTSQRSDTQVVGMAPPPLERLAVRIDLGPFADPGSVQMRRVRTAIALQVDRASPRFSVAAAKTSAKRALRDDRQWWRRARRRTERFQHREAHV